MHILPLFSTVRSQVLLLSWSSFPGYECEVLLRDELASTATPPSFTSSLPVPGDGL
jgi:hypothetical protein